MIQLSFTFDSIEAAQEFLEAVNGPKVITTDAPPVERVRKPRSDAGQPRGPYKRREESPVQTAAPTQTPAATPPAPSAPEAAAPATAPTVLTLVHVREAMTGRPTEKNIALLKKFGYSKSSDLPPAKYAEFIAACKRGE